MEAAIMGRHAHWTEITPYGQLLCAAKGGVLHTPAQSLHETFTKALERLSREELSEVPCSRAEYWVRSHELDAFFDDSTLFALAQIAEDFGRLEEPVSWWARMVTCVTMTGHSSGYLSYRTMPPNMQIRSNRQRLLNEKNGPTESRNPYELLYRKSARLASGEPFTGTRMRFGPPDSAELILTSPPFLDVIDYHDTNWIRHLWLDRECPKSELVTGDLTEWLRAMQSHLKQWAEILAPRGRIAVEAGTVKNGQVNLIDAVIALAEGMGFIPETLFIQEADFSRTAKCWGVEKTQGTKTQQVAVFRLP